MERIEQQIQELLEQANSTLYGNSLSKEDFAKLMELVKHTNPTQIYGVDDVLSNFRGDEVLLIKANSRDIEEEIFQKVMRPRIRGSLVAYSLEILHSLYGEELVSKNTVKITNPDEFADYIAEKIQKNSFLRRRLQTPLHMDKVFVCRILDTTYLVVEPYIF